MRVSSIFWVCVCVWCVGTRCVWAPCVLCWGSRCVSALSFLRWVCLTSFFRSNFRHYRSNFRDYHTTLGITTLGRLRHSVTFEPKRIIKMARMWLWTRRLMKESSKLDERKLRASWKKASSLMKESSESIGNKESKDLKLQAIVYQLEAWGNSLSTCSLMQ